MANSTVMKMVVQELSRYGFKANDKYVNWGKSCTDADKAKVVPGGEYDMDVFTAESGKQYINKVLEQVNPSAMLAKAPEKKAFVLKATPSAKPLDSGMSKDEWAAKDVRISRQGLIQAAVQAVSPLVSLEKVYPEAEKLADLMLVYVNRK